MDITGRLGGLVSAASIAACVLVVGCGPAGAQVEGAGPSATAPATPTPVPDGCEMQAAIVGHDGDAGLRQDVAGEVLQERVGAEGVQDGWIAFGHGN